MSEADNPTTPRKRSSHRPTGFGPLSRDKKVLSQEPASLPDEASIPPSPTDDRSPTPHCSEPASAAEPETDTAMAELGATDLPPDESSATVAWVNRLTSEFKAATTTDDLDAQRQQLQEQNLRLQAQNRDLLEQKAILEVTLEETQTALQLQITRSQNQEILLVQQAQALAESQAQTSGLYRDLALAQQTAQRQQIMIETLTEQLESSQERVAQLEQEVATAQVRVNEKTHALMQAEIACRDLKTRLSRQQRYALQFKTALERCLDMPALRRSMVNATATRAEANTVADTGDPLATDAGSLGRSEGSGRTDVTSTATPPSGASAFAHPDHPNLASVDLVEVSSHLHSLLNEAAASSMLDASATLVAGSHEHLDHEHLDHEHLDHEHLDEAEAAESVTTPVWVADTPPIAVTHPDRTSEQGTEQGAEQKTEQETQQKTDRSDWIDDHWEEAKGEAAKAPDAQATVDQADCPPIGMTPPAAAAGATTEMSSEARGSEGREDRLEAPITTPADPDLAKGDTPPASPVPFAPDRVQVDLWQRLNQWTTAAETVETVETAETVETVETVETPALAAMAASDLQAANTPTDTDLTTDLTADAIVTPLPAQRGIQPLRPSPQIPKFVSQWSEATGRTARTEAQPPATPSIADVSEAQAVPPVTSFTVNCRRQEAPPRSETPATPQAATASKRIELPHPQGETAAAFPTVGQSVPPVTTPEDGGQARANWPSPLVYPLRPAKKRKSLAAIDLPNFARPHT